jgi:type 2A phosphatase activator TIP41
MLNYRQDNNANSIGSVVDGEFYQSQHKINTEKLSQPDPILFFDDVVLYEDELGDNGSGFLSVKIVVFN